MNREIHTPEIYRKKNVVVPNFYPSFKLEWAHFGEGKTSTIDIYRIEEEQIPDRDSSG